MISFLKVDLVWLGNEVLRSARSDRNSLRSLIQPSELQIKEFAEKDILFFRPRSLILPPKLERKKEKNIY